MFSGLYPCRMAVTEDDGATWSGLKPVGDWGGTVTMGCVTDLKTGPGHYLAMFHIILKLSSVMMKVRLKLSELDAMQKSVLGRVCD